MIYLVILLLSLSACSDTEFKVRDDGNTITIFGDSASVDFYAERGTRVGAPSAVFCTAHTSEPRVTTCEDGRGYLTDDPLKAQFADLEWHAFHERGRGPWWPPLELFVTQDPADYAVNISTGSTIIIQAPDGRSLTLDFSGDTLRTSGDLPLDEAGKRFAEFAHFYVNNCDEPDTFHVFYSAPAVHAPDLGDSRAAEFERLRGRLSR